ncbi:DUF4340 domain-containing protein [Pseudobacteriovorax antillogorgiicola]|uniref:DUF4340 domain-containing protein n=1 Tax=Pseudobacteriovorax antillogorgiicola TaxID=1513793 RepID=A0A1Y6CJ63_9BACT|nr:DUF4340 domain-containing protein [Pseudobacteriovorax antillogorgiicola]TCS48630.1 uncharacterized protein DUF4340 [Pseudobacteriovorax antillogorgiicola]SMF55365.1 protein of unknown function [Pseudobacteriovorax antillogorgiicola]
MNSRVLPYFVLFLIGLAGAYWASGPKDKVDRGQVWLNIDGKIELITYQDPKKRVIVDADQRWVTEAEMQDGIDLPPVEYKAGKAFENVLEDLETLRALKTIGKFSEVSAEEYGFAGEEKTTLIIKTKNEEYSFEIGKRSFQTSNVFVRDMKRDEVILVSRSAINILRNAKARLYERKPYNFDLNDDVVAVQISRGDKSLELVKEGRSEKGKVVWKRSDKDDKADSEASWLEKVLKLQVKKYATPVERQNLDKADALVTIGFKGQKNDVESMSILKLNPGGDELEQFWLKSNYVKTYVLVDSNRAKTLVQDLSNFLM